MRSIPRATTQGQRSCRNSHFCVHQWEGMCWRELGSEEHSCDKLHKSTLADLLLALSTWAVFRTLWKWMCCHVVSAATKSCTGTVNCGLNIQVDLPSERIQAQCQPLQMLVALGLEAQRPPLFCTNDKGSQLYSDSCSSVRNSVAEGGRNPWAHIHASHQMAWSALHSMSKVKEFSHSMSYSPRDV